MKETGFKINWIVYFQNYLEYKNKILFHAIELIEQIISREIHTLERKYK